MKALGRYAIVSLLVVAAVVVALWSFTTAEGHRSLLVAGGIAWPVQCLAFGLLVRAKAHPSRFMLWWGAGIAARVGLVIVVGLAISRLEGMDPSVLLLSVAGFFFVLLLMEPAFFERTNDTARLAK